MRANKLVNDSRQGISKKMPKTVQESKIAGPTIPAGQTQNSPENNWAAATDDSVQRFENFSDSNNTLNREELDEFFISKKTKIRHHPEHGLVKSADRRFAKRSTVKNYLKTAKHILQRCLDYLEERGKSDGIDRDGLEDHIKRLMRGWKTKTRTRYIGCLRRFLEIHPNGLNRIEADFAKHVLELFLKHRHIEVSKSDGTSGTIDGRKNYEDRITAFDEYKFPKILHEIEQRLKSKSKIKSKFLTPLYNWLIAGITTGVRSIEWQHASINRKTDCNSPRGVRILLKVPNSKASIAHGHKMYRILDISSFDDEAIRAIEFMCEQCRIWSNDGSYGNVKEGCTRLLQRICKKLFSDSDGAVRYTLTNLRQQFIANMLAIESETNVALIAGHENVSSNKLYPSVERAWELKKIRNRPKYHKV